MNNLQLPLLTAFIWCLVCNFLSQKAECLEYTEAQKEEFVKVHNHYRSKANPKPTTPLNLLKWDKDLEKRCKDSLCKSGCAFKHTSHEVRDGRGENLCQYGWSQGYSEPKKAASPSYCVKGWYDEKRDFDHKTYKCSKDKVCGHYTQLMWGPATAIGCAKCKSTIKTWEGNILDAVVVMCQYDKIQMSGETFYQYDKNSSCGKCPLGDEFPADQKAPPGTDASTVKGKFSGYCEGSNKAVTLHSPSTKILLYALLPLITAALL